MKRVDKRTVQRFRRRTIVLHWVHSLAFLVLLITGAIILFQGTGFNSISQVIRLHQTAAFVYIVTPLVYFFLAPGRTAGFIVETFQWSKDDLRWFILAPAYYFGGAESNMPPQGHINAGQKLWQALILITGLIFVVTGIILSFFQYQIPISVYQWILVTHGAAFVIILVIFLLHVYLAVFHPRFKESLRAILDGKISPSYARQHYPKWYEKLTGNNK